MLILSRKVGESIEIVGIGTITITKISKNNVRIGIDAGRNIEIVRSELKDGSPKPQPQKELKSAA